jgi:hypothetical protein
MTIRIDTTEYRFTHGQAPRGTGHWAFDFFRDGACHTAFAPGQMTLAEAKRWALREAKQIGGIVEIHVAP